MRPTNRESHSHTTSTIFCQVYVHVLLVQHPKSVFSQHMVWSNIRNRLGAEKAEKLVKHTDFTEMKITSRTYTNFPSNFCFVSSP